MLRKRSCWVFFKKKWSDPELLEVWCNNFPLADTPHKTGESSLAFCWRKGEGNPLVSFTPLLKGTAKPSSLHSSFKFWSSGAGKRPEAILQWENGLTGWGGGEGSVNSNIHKNKSSWLSWWEDRFQTSTKFLCLRANNISSLPLNNEREDPKDNEAAGVFLTDLTLSLDSATSSLPIPRNAKKEVKPVFGNLRVMVQ